MAERWRVGRSVGRTLYRGERLVGLVDSEEIALEIIHALNARGRSLVQVAAESIEAFAERLGPHFADRPDGDNEQRHVAHGMRQAVAILRRIAEREVGRESPGSAGGGCDG